MSKFFGPILRPAPSVFQPGWVIEGITTYTETRFSKGGRGRNPYFEMIYRAQITENAMPSLKQAAYNPYIQPYGRIYVVGYMMINYLFETYGDDVMARFYRQMEKNPLAPYRAFEIVTGKPTETLYRDMIRFYSERFEPLYDLPLGERFSKGVRIDYGRPVATIQGILSYQNASNDRSDYPRHSLLSERFERQSVALRFFGSRYGSRTADCVCLPDRRQRLRRSFRRQPHPLLRI